VRKRVRKAAEERARKVSEAAEEANREEDRKVELRHGKALGLEGKLTPDEIKKKYRQLMTQYHPDKVLGMGDEIREVAERKAKEINEAYDYFRKKYDL
jgi:DnaJ-domain-containing protein 1